MSGLTGRTVAVAEGRQLDELVEMLLKEGALPLRCPMVSILDSPDTPAIAAWLDELLAGRFALVILMTGEALRRLVDFADKSGKRDAFIALLGKVDILTRGPKPVKALKEIGLPPTYVAEKPTTDGVITTLMSLQLQGKTVGLTLYGEPNDRLEQYLMSAGATVKSVMPYIFAPSSDTAKVVDLINALDGNRVDSIVFTSSPQVDRLFEVAGEQGLEAKLRLGLAKTCVAVVGPVVAQSLVERQIHVDVCPEQGFVMKNLITHLKRAFANK